MLRASLLRLTCGRLSVDMSKVNILYMAGAGRSGTTLLSRLLDLEADHRAVGELRALGEEAVWGLMCGCGNRHDACPVWGPIIDAWSDQSRLAAWREIITARSIGPLMRRDAQSSWDGSPRGLDELRRVYEANLAEPGTVLVDESKHPWLGWVLARQSWADVRFVQIVRDPDDVVTSWSTAKDYHKQTPAEEVARRWLTRQATSEGLRRSCGRPWLRISYQELVNAPQETLEKVLGRPSTGLLWDGQVWAFSSRENHIYLSNSDKLRRGHEVVRATSPGAADRGRRGAFQRLARRVYQSMVQDAPFTWQSHGARCPGG